MGTLAIVCAGLVLLTAIAYGGVLSADFVNFDDPAYISENPVVRSGLNFRSVGWAFTSTENANWHPLTWISHMLDVQLFGLDAGWHHAVNLALHCLNSVVLLLLLLRMTGRLWACSLAAALFALHPLRVESVAWVAERKDLLSTLFWLLTWAAWLGFIRTRHPARYLLALTLFALGLMAKPMLVTLPFTLLLLDLWPLGRLPSPIGSSPRAWGRLVLEKLPFLALSAASAAITYAAQQAGGAVQPFAAVPFPARMANALLSYATYIREALWPSGLGCFYPYAEAVPLSAPTVAAALLLAGVTALVLSNLRRSPYLTFGWLWYLGTLVPVLGLVQVGGQSHADRYTYVPLIGLFVAAAFGMDALVRAFPRLRTPVALLACAALLASAAATRAQTVHWRDSERLFRRALAVTQDNWVAHINLGKALSELGRWDEAAKHFREAMRIQPDSADAHNNLGTVLARLGRFDQAEAAYAEALRLRPGDAQTIENLGLALASQARYPEAIERFRQAVAADPERASARCNLGAALARENRVAEAAEQFRQALRIAPDFTLARENLSALEGPPPAPPPRPADR